MTNFGKNIKKIRTIQKLSQTKFAELFDLSRASVGAYEEGRAEAKLDVISKIAKYFSITVDDLINKEITVNELYHFNIFDDKFGNKINIGTEVLKNIEFNQVPLVITHDLLTKSIETAATEAENHITLPNFKNHLAIIVERSAYTHIASSISNNDILIAYRSFEFDNQTSLNGKLWLIKTNKTLQCSEVRKSGNNELLLFPDDGAPYAIDIDKIEYILPIDTHINRTPELKNTLHDQLGKIEHQINDLYNRL